MGELEGRGELAELNKLGITLSKQMSRVQAHQIEKPKFELGNKEPIEKNKEFFQQPFDSP